MTMGEKILRLRKARGWNQEELAEQIDVTRQAISRWESDSAKPDADNIVALCNLFGISADYLLNTDPTAASISADNPVPFVNKSSLHRSVIGIVFMILGILMLFALTLVSAIDPWTYFNGFTSYGGLTGYILAHDMQWLVVCIALLFFGGLGMLLWKYLVSIWNKAAELLKK